MRRAISAISLLLVLPVSDLRADDWPQWLGPRRDSVWRETGIIDKFPDGGPKVKWRVPVAGGFSGPAVASGRVFVMDFVPGDGKSTNSPVARDKVKGKERVLCFAIEDGKPLWKHEYDCAYNISYAIGPRCTPTVAGGKVYTLGAEGNLFCLDAEKGTVLWSRDLPKEYKIETPFWGFAGHPLVAGQKLFCLVGGKDTTAVAFDKDNGKELWHALSAKLPGYCPPTMIEAGGKRQLLIWHSEAINSLNPEDGKLYWSIPLEPKYAMSVTPPRLLGDKLFAGGIGDVAAVMKLSANKLEAEVLWRGKPNNAVYCCNSTPFLEDGTIYGCDVRQGQMRAVKLDDGAILWDTWKPTTGGKRGGHGTAFIVKNADRFFLMSETGELMIARLTPKAYEEVSRCKLLEATSPIFSRDVVWSHPAFANQCIYARNDKELVCASLAK
jgi:outer membrane protein assembly factor BamB